MGGGYESFDCNHNDETNALIDCCVESDGISLLQDSNGGWDNSGGGSEQADY